jgi:hypothetical protein
VLGGAAALGEVCERVSVDLIAERLSDDAVQPEVSHYSRRHTCTRSRSSTTQAGNATTARAGEPEVLGLHLLTAAAQKGADPSCRGRCSCGSKDTPQAHETRPGEG